ncbi:hypothetical protein G9A89_021677, partial [Geosiphon pyriformis]
NCEINYGKVRTSAREEKEDDNDSYCSASSFVQPVTTSPDPADPEAHLEVARDDGFILVYKNIDAKQFNDIREQQRKDMKNVIEKAKDQHKEVLESLKKNIKKIREVKRTLPDSDPMYKAAVAEAKKNLRLFKDPYEEYSEGPMHKKRRKSIENQTRFSDSKVTFFSRANDEMKREEQYGVRKSWEALYKELWNKHLLAPKDPVINIPVPQVNAIIRDMENDVNQLLVDCAGMVEQV